jgi:hypothetical protein
MFLGLFTIDQWLSVKDIGTYLEVKRDTAYKGIIASGCLRTSAGVFRNSKKDKVD